jgi:hypothetical protein
VSAFYKVRDFVQSQVDARGLYPLVFEQQILEGRYKTARWTVYDHVNNRVWDFRKPEPYDSVARFSHDYVSLLCYLRTLPLAVGDTFSIECFVHGKDYPVFFRVRHRETVKVDAGTFKCLMLEPRMVGEGRGFTRKDQMAIWVTDDKYHMPVLIKAKVKIGSLSAKLLRYERR